MNLNPVILRHDRDRANRHCERSEAIQRLPGLKFCLDCFVAVLLAMTAASGHYFSTPRPRR
jgi:hypothetical protein